MIDWKHHNGIHQMNSQFLNSLIQWEKFKCTMNLTNGNEFQSKKSRGMKSVDLNSIVAIIPRDWIEILPDITRVSLPTAQSSYLVKWNGKKKKKKGKKGEKREKGEKKKKKRRKKRKKMIENR